jgi:hypothetical protein
MMRLSRMRARRLSWMISRDHLTLIEKVVKLTTTARFSIWLL